MHHFDAQTLSIVDELILFLLQDIYVSLGRIKTSLTFQNLNDAIPTAAGIFGSCRSGSNVSDRRGLIHMKSIQCDLDSYILMQIVRPNSLQLP